MECVILDGSLLLDFQGKFKETRVVTSSGNDERAAYEASQDISDARLSILISARSKRNPDPDGPDDPNSNNSSNANTTMYIISACVVGGVALLVLAVALVQFWRIRTGRSTMGRKLFWATENSRHQQVLAPSDSSFSNVTQIIVEESKKS